MKTAYSYRCDRPWSLSCQSLQMPLIWRGSSRAAVDADELFSFKNEQIAAAFGVMGVARRHTFDLGVRSPERAARFFEWLSTVDMDPDRFCQRAARDLVPNPKRFPLHPIKGTFQSWPWPYLNIRLGVVADSQKSLEERVDVLKRLPAAVRYIVVDGSWNVDLSWVLPKTTQSHMAMDIEGALRNPRILRAFVSDDGKRIPPKVAAKELMEALAKGHTLFPMCKCPGFDPQNGCRREVPGIDWVVAHPRGMDSVDVIRSIAGQCQKYSVPLFVRPPLTFEGEGAGWPEGWPNELRVQEFPGRG